MEVSILFCFSLKMQCILQVYLSVFLPTAGQDNKSKRQKERKDRKGTAAKLQLQATLMTHQMQALLDALKINATKSWSVNPLRRAAAPSALVFRCCLGKKKNATLGNIFGISILRTKLCLWWLKLWGCVFDRDSENSTQNKIFLYILG